MSRFGRWLLTVALLVAVGGLLGHRFGWTLRVIEYDYVVLPADYLELGLRLGLLAGTILGAVQVVGRRPLPSWRALAVALVAVGVISLLVLGGAGWATVLLFENGRLDAGWQLPNPRRHALFLGLDAGARAGPILGALVGSAILWRARTADIDDASARATVAPGASSTSDTSDTSSASRT